MGEDARLHRDLCARFIRWYEDAPAGLTKPYAGVEAALRAIPLGVMMSIVSLAAIVLAVWLWRKRDPHDSIDVEIVVDQTESNNSPG